MEMTVKKFLGSMIEGVCLPLDRQYQQNLAEWAVKCAMCNDTVEPHPRFFTDAECHEFREKRTIPERTQVFAANFTGRSLDSHGSDIYLNKTANKQLVARWHFYTVMVGHVVLQLLSLHPEPEHKDNTFNIRPFRGPWNRLAIQIWPSEKRLTWPPPMSLSTLHGATYYGDFRKRFQNENGYEMLPIITEAQRSPARK